ncbi:MAG TPA: hypothetical protein VJO33_01205 [Gemmatimonadaceae bacterium]|nr:hypothetical protein [Gemmatimonadaceae bacterium]
MSERPSAQSGAGGPIKDNDHIRSNPDAFQAAYARARQQLGKIKGVIGVGYGLKATGPRFTQDVAILVYVLQKKPNDEVPADQRIPPLFEGYRTDIRIFTSAKATLKCDDDTPYPDIHGGVQIEAWGQDTPKLLVTNGTMACIARKRGSAAPDNVYLLTCQHVLLDKDIKTKPNDGVYHPYKPRTIAGHPELAHGTLLGRIDEDDTFKGHVDQDGYQVDPLAQLADPTPPILLEELPATFDGIFVDAAVVHLDLGSYCWGAKCPTGDNNLVWSPLIPGINPTGPMPGGLPESQRDSVTDVRDIRGDQSAVGEKVFKVGRSTAWTAGIITGVNVPGHQVLTISLNNPPEHIVEEIRYNIIEIILDPATPNQQNCHNQNAFSDNGDSGALVVDDQNRAIGLLCAGGGEPDPQTGAIKSTACFITPALDAVEVYVETTTGTSHGAKNATDGSGAGPQTAFDQPAASTPGVILVSYVRTPKRRPPPVGPAPAIDLTEAQRAHVLAVRDEMLATPRAAELYASVVELRREIAYLVRSCRPVTVTWHRNRGPAFLAHLINYLRGDAESIPTKIGDISRAELLTNICHVLAKHGSNPLRQAIEQHRSDLAAVATGTTLHEIIGALSAHEDTGVIA